MSRGTLDHIQSLLSFAYGTFTLSGGPFQTSSATILPSCERVRNPDEVNFFGLGSSLFARRYLGNRFFFLFLRVLRCFSSPGLPSPTYLFSRRYLNITSSGFPHSDIPGSMLACSSSRLFAAYHVLLRLLVPRHPPFALISLTICCFAALIN